MQDIKTSNQQFAPQINKFQHRNKRNMKNQDNMIPQNINNSIETDTKDSEEEESPKKRIQDMIIRMISQMPLAHACNPSYSGGRDQENHSLKLAWANSL
jgi:hypothetical protein